MEKVAGIGGFFFRAKDPQGLAKWHERHLGVTLTPGSYDSPCWQQEAGITVFEPFPADTDYFGNAANAWMINFRARSLDAMADQLRSAGIAVDVDPQTYPNGRFARLNDPEGNPIAIWQPEDGDAPQPGEGQA
jgi:catechol 2,3-dioxygenase-like lactoylglutathione lyase family enzyme